MTDVVERLDNVLHLGVEDENTEVYICFHCPGCKYGHGFRIKGKAGPIWDWNESLTSPTFSPSLLVNKDDPASRCHSFVRDGKIEFLGDCWHELKGQTVPLDPVDEP